MRRLILLLSIVSGFLISAQIGIKTASPKAILDVNGDMNLRGKLSVLNTTDNTIFGGTNDQILVSQGEGYPPVWKSLRIPDYEQNKFFLIYNNSFSDTQGVIFNSNEEPATPTALSTLSSLFVKNTSFSSLDTFKKIPSLSQQFEAYSAQSKVYFQFETVVQGTFDANGNPDSSIDYACGVFIDEKLANIRLRNIKASSATNTFITHNQIGMAQNLSKGTHTISVGCKRLKSYNTNATLGIGTYVHNNINSFITQSFLRVDVYEVPQVFNTIIN
ncbi:hypothetical protein [Chryseobacterium taichungense]|uniref:hypothetical protein n=1 Tax=Chryseobacterium taichungense TaxID=295069 RepID=UPI0028B039E3|nr:hypothetical protein [Chryseobacterium taichungense]